MVNLFLFCKKIRIQAIVFLCGVTISTYSCVDTQRNNAIPSAKSSALDKGNINHVEYIRSRDKVIKPENRVYKDSIFVDHVIKRYLEKPEHVKYISDRSLLRKLKNKVCWDSYVLILDTLDDGSQCRIEITLGDFDLKNHQLKYNEQGNLIAVDSKWPFGAIHKKHPLKEIQELSIAIDGKAIPIPKSAYQNIYEPEFCNFGSYQRITEAYLHKDNIYLYIFGGNAADSYLAKLIFSPSEYETSIIVDYVPMSSFGSFHEGFVGF